MVFFEADNVSEANTIRPQDLGVENFPARAV
jgi:hypothetical protein